MVQCPYRAREAPAARCSELPREAVGADSAATADGLDQFGWTGAVGGVPIVVAIGRRPDRAGVCLRSSCPTNNLGPFAVTRRCCRPAGLNQPEFDRRRWNPRRPKHKDRVAFLEPAIRSRGLLRSGSIRSWRFGRRNTSSSTGPRGPSLDRGNVFRWQITPTRCASGKAARTPAVA